MAVLNKFQQMQEDKRNKIIMNKVSKKDSIGKYEFIFLNTSPSSQKMQVITKYHDNNENINLANKAKPKTKNINHYNS